MGNPASQRVRSAIVAALSLMVVGLAPAKAAEPIPIEAFFEYPAMTGGEISPSGRQMLILTRSPGGRQELLLVDTKTLEGHALASFKDADVIDAHWISDKRIVYQPADLTAGIADDQAAKVGLMAVDATGTDLRRLPRVAFLSALRGLDSDRIAVLGPKTDKFFKFDAWATRVVDTRHPNPVALWYETYDKWFGASHWIYGLDDTPQVADGFRDGRPFTVAWDDNARKWRSIIEELDGGAPIAVAPDGALLVKYRGRPARDTAALYRFDLDRLAYDAEPLVQSKEFDVEPTVLMDGKRLLGVRYPADVMNTVWFDEKLAAVQRDVDAALPGRVNEVQVPTRAQVPLVLVNSYSDRDPGAWYLFDTEAKTLKKVGDEMAGIDPQRMGKREFVRYKARDGLGIPAWLTLPAGAARDARLPMVVLVHGGPYTQGADWKWSAESAFLASRGYAVLEPQFRGTRGYGLRHFEAGIKQWGLAMQDDLTDGARWAIEQGVADAARICIAGASYGGYATLMGLIKEPALFRCGIDWAGPTDIELMYTAWFSDSTENTRAIWAMTTADLERDAEQIKATSPLRMAEKITQPVLLAYGGEDKRVPITHGRRFRRSLEQTNKDVEWVEYPEEGHGWRKVKNRVDFWRRVEAFLGRTIGNPRRTTPQAAAQ
jgi:acetyl esterase/lipase